MAIDKRTFRNNLQYYMSTGMPVEEAFQYMLQKHGFDASISNIPTQVNRLVNTGVPFERALEIVEKATFDNNFDPYKAALQEYRNRVYRSPEPNGKTSINTPKAIDVNGIIRDTLIKDALSNKPELGNGYYPPMGISTSPNSQHSQYSVVPKQPITEGMTPVPTKYPYELGTKDNQDIQDTAPEGYTPMPVSRNYTPIPRGYSPIPANTSTTPVTESVAKTGTNQVSNPTVRRVNTPRATQASTPVTTPTLSTVIPQAVRHNGGFDNYRRESVLSALRSAGGISPAEAVQRGIIPMEALNYI
jgi:hypothetical protein